MKTSDHFFGRARTTVPTLPKAPSMKRPKRDDLMDAPKKSLASAAPTKGKKPGKVSANQKEMLLSIEGKKPAAKKAAKPARSAGRRKAG